MNKYRILLIYVVIVSAMVALGFWLLKSSEKQTANLPGQTFPNLGQEHITQASTDHKPYNSNPPTSGPHWPQPANWGAYSTTQADEQMVHNLEHGGIWISYKPGRVDKNTINPLDDFAMRYPLIIVEPRAPDDTATALPALTQLQNLDKYNEPPTLE